MLFKKTTGPKTKVEVESEPSFAWENPDQTFQQMWVNVDKWNFVVEPSLQSAPGTTFDFVFEGIAATGPLANFRVSASLQLRERSKPPEYISTRWPEHLNDLQGFARLGQPITREPSLYVTLFCQPMTFDWVYRTFILGTSTSGTLGYQLTLDCPSAHEEKFWSKQWLSEHLRIENWRLESNWSRPLDR